MTTTTYSVSGMTCTGCEAKISFLLSKVSDVKSVTVNLSLGEVILTSEQKLPLFALKQAISDYPKYSIEEKNPDLQLNQEKLYSENNKNWFQIYKPVVLLFFYITLVAVLTGIEKNKFNLIKAMNVFMSAFFIAFSFFKLLNLKAFADSYAMYDVIAKKIKFWAYIYAFLELMLGVLYAIDFNPFLLNLVTVMVMSVSLIGVAQSVLKKKNIQCACLGAVFNLPMSSLTLVEDSIMILMSGFMLIIC